MVICKICNKEFTNINNLSKHLFIHKLTILDYYIKYENFEIPKCSCGSDLKIRKGLIFHKTCCSEQCKSILSKNRHHSDNTKENISNKRKLYLLNNKDKHPWKNNNKFISKPCEYLKEILNKLNIEFISEYNPLSNYNYSIDIVLPNKKIGIEVNGNQHYNKDKTLKEYYQKRKEIIEESGWILYDIHYSKVYDNNFINLFFK